MLTDAPKRDTITVIPDDVGVQYASARLVGDLDTARGYKALILQGTPELDYAEEHARLGCFLTATPGVPASLGDILLAQADAEANRAILAWVLGTAPLNILDEADAFDRIGCPLTPTGEQLRASTQVLVDFYTRVAEGARRRLAEMDTPHASTAPTPAKTSSGSCKPPTVTSPRSAPNPMSVPVGTCSAASRTRRAETGTPQSVDNRTLKRQMDHTV